MSGLETQLQVIDAENLTPLVRKALGSAQAQVTDWSYSSLVGSAINPVTAGIYRFSGAARDGDHERAWSLVLKVIHWVDLSGARLAQNYLNEPPDWNYWKREALVYQSGLLEGWRGNLVPVRCCEVAEQADSSVWLWLEYIQEAGDSAWSLDRHALAARHFGEFNGAWASRPIPDYPWLCRGFTRQWVRTFRHLSRLEVVRNPATWQHPRVKLAFPVPIAEPFMRLVADSDRLLAHLEQLPHTLSHLDTHRPNLFARRRGPEHQTVVIDWSFLGTAAVGEDLGMQVSGNLYFLTVEPSKAHTYYDRALEAYMEGLRASGWRGNPKAVRFACATAACLRYALFATSRLRSLVGPVEERTWADDTAKKRGWPVEETLRHWGAAVRFLLDLGDRARQLAPGSTLSDSPPSLTQR